MREFRVLANGASSIKQTRQIRLLLWSAVAALSVVTLFAVYGTSSIGPVLSTVLEGFAGLIVVFVIVSAYVLAYRHACDVVARDSVFVLTDTQLIRRRTGHPDVQIDLGEINSLCEGHGWIVVESIEEKIAIPEDVQEFASLRAELTRRAKVVRPRRRSLAPIIVVVYLLYWAGVLWSRNSLLTAVAGAIGLTLLCWQSFLLAKPFATSRIRLLSWGWISLGWLAAALFICFRLLRR